MSTVDCKVVFLGSASAGKTCLIHRYIHGNFNTKTETTIAGSFAAKTEQLPNVSVSLGCWDTAGSERYASISRMYYRNARAAVICFDLTSKASYYNARDWISQLLGVEKDCRIYLCGTKLDLVADKTERREVDKKTALELTQDLHSDYFETSSKTGENVDQLFKKIAKDYAIQEENFACNGKLVEDSIKLHQSSWKNDPRIRKQESTCCH